MSVWDLVFGTKARLRNKEDKLKREIDELLKMPCSHSRSVRYAVLSGKLRKVREKISNS